MMKKDELKASLSRLGGELICPAGIFIRDQKVLWGLRHYKADKWKDISVLTCPGGRCDRGETIEQTLRREVAEEIGITDFNMIEHLKDIARAKQGDIVPLFLCNTNQSPKLMEPYKFSEWKWFSLNNLPENFINKEGREIVVNLLTAKARM